LGSKIFGYARVSTSEQNLDRQLDILVQNGVAKEDIFTDKISGTKHNRAALDELQRVLRTGDTVITESLSRLSRSSQDLLTILNDWGNRGVVFKSLKEDLNFSTTTGKLLLTLLAALSQFERDTIRDRVLEGIASARSRGRVGGRPTTDKKMLASAVRLHESKVLSLAEILKTTKVSKSVLYRELKRRCELVDSVSDNLEKQE